MGNIQTFEEVKLDLPITSGPYEPTWKSIEANYSGTPEWLRDSKFGIWIHFGPQSAGESGDWYARKMYVEGTPAYENHLKNYGHPSEVGYKEVLRDWNPKKFDPQALVDIYKDAGARFLIIQGVHHDQLDMWDSKYQPWVSIRPTTGIKPLYTTIATVTMNLIVSAAIVLLNPYVTVYISYKIPPFALSVHIPDVSTSIYVEVDSKVLLGLPFCDKASGRLHHSGTPLGLHRVPYR